MREIKYRAWDTKLKIMNDWTRVKEMFKRYLDDPDIVMLQYTGLKDKNGKEIYEGDIIKKPGYEDWDGDWVSEETGDIHWEVSTARFTSLVGGQFIPNERSEVIGNIYENPELVKGGC